MRFLLSMSLIKSTRTLIGTCFGGMAVSLRTNKISQHLATSDVRPSARSLFRKAPEESSGSAVDPHLEVFPRLTFVDALYEQRGLVNIAAELNFQFRVRRSQTSRDLIVPSFDPSDLYSFSSS